MVSNTVAKYMFRNHKHRLYPLITATSYARNLLIARIQRNQKEQVFATFV